MRYDCSSLETQCRSWLHHGGNHPTLFHEVLRFAQVRAAAVFRRSPADAQDLASYFLEKLWAYWRRPGFNPEPWQANPLACLNQFFRSRTLEFLRSRRSLQTHELPDEALLAGKVAPLEGGPENSVLREETAREVRATLELFPDKLRQAYETRYAQDLPPRQAAQALNWEVGEVYRATAELKRRVRVLWPETCPEGLSRRAA